MKLPWPQQIPSGLALMLRGMQEELIPGAQLFNAGHWWEAHEAWEAEWLNASGPERQFIQTLILLAAALHKRWAHGSLSARNYQKALVKLADFPDVYGGVDLRQLRLEVQQALQVEGMRPQLPVAHQANLTSEVQKR